MNEPPIKRDERIITLNMWSAIITNGVFIASLCIAALRLPQVSINLSRQKIFYHKFYFKKKKRNYW